MGRLRDIELNRGIANVTVTVVCHNSRGETIDLSHVFTSTFSMWLPGHDLTPAIDAAAATPDPDQVTNPGQVSYTFTEADMAAISPGTYRGVFTMLWTTVPNETIVKFPTELLYIEVNEG